MARTPFCSQVLLAEGSVAARLELESQNPHLPAAMRPAASPVK